MTNAAQWVVRRLPPMPRFRTEREFRKLSKKTLAINCWAATVNDDWSMYAASEAWARCAELVEMIEGRRDVDRDLIASLKEQRAHVERCRAGACEHKFAALVRAGVTDDAPDDDAATSGRGEPEGATHE